MHVSQSTVPLKSTLTLQKIQSLKLLFSPLAFVETLRLLLLDIELTVVAFVAVHVDVQDYIVADVWRR